MMVNTMMDSRKSKSQKTVTLTVSIVTSFCSAYILSSVNVALPVMGELFRMTSMALGWVNTSYLLANAVLMVPFGRMGDIYGRKKIFTYGLVILLFSNILCGLANSGHLIVIMRIIQGIGSAMIIGTIVAIVTSVFPGDERGKALGISVGAVYAGLTAGPFLGGVFTQHFGWRSIFFFGAFLTGITLILTVARLKEDLTEAAGEKFDMRGSLLFVVALGLFIYGFTLLPQSSGFVMLFIGSAGLILFTLHERRIENPVLNIAVLYRNRVFFFSNISTAVFYISSNALTFLLSLYLQYIQKYPPQEAGLILLISPIIMAIFSPLTGQLSDRFPSQVVAAIGMGLSCSCMVFFSLLDGSSKPAFIIIIMFLFGLATALFSSPNSNAVMGSVEKRYLGVAAGALGTSRTIGMVMSMGIVMILFTTLIGGAQITPEYYPAFLTVMKTGFIIFAVISLLGVFIQLAGRKRN